MSCTTYQSFSIKAASVPNSRAASSITVLSGTTFIGNGYIVVADLSADSFVHTDQSAGRHLGGTPFLIVSRRSGRSRRSTQPIQCLLCQSRQRLNRYCIAGERRHLCLDIKPIADLDQFPFFSERQQGPAHLIITP